MRFGQPLVERHRMARVSDGALERVMAGSFSDRVVS